MLYRVLNLCNKAKPRISVARHAVWDAPCTASVERASVGWRSCQNLYPSPSSFDVFSSVASTREAITAKLVGILCGSLACLPDLGLNTAVNRYTESSAYVSRTLDQRRDIFPHSRTLIISRKEVVVFLKMAIFHEMRVATKFRGWTDHRRGRGIYTCSIFVYHRSIHIYMHTYMHIHTYACLRP